ncbi:MAG: TRAP transporter substrate-binding protein [Sphingomonadales bacterium]
MDLTKNLLAASLIFVAACSDAPVVGEPAGESQPVRWKMTSTFPSSLIQLGTMGKRFSEQINKVSGGNIEIRFYEPGALAPALEGFDAVSYGAIEAGWSTSGYWAGKELALQLFGSVPFGPDAPEYLAWFYFGGGKEIFEDIYHQHNIHSIICGITAPEASGWFKDEINSVEDFQGKKIRFFGLGARVLNKLGANSQLLAGGDIFPALELGTIDGAEFSMPAVDYDMGFYQVAKNYYFPGWHQQSTMYEVTINLDAWNSLNPTQQAQIETTCGDNVRFGIAEGEALQFQAMKNLEAKGVTLHTWSPEILAALEAAWQEVVAEMSAEDENFRRGWESLSAFRRDYKVWRDKGYLK